MLKLTQLIQKKILFLFVFLNYGILAYGVSVKAEVCFINHSQSDCVFHSPAELASATNIDTITLTFENIDIIVNNESTYVVDKWGVLFSSPGRDSGTVEKFYCNQLNCAQNAIEVDANNQNITVITPENPGAQQNHLVGTIIITLSRFKNGQLPPKLQSLINGATNGAIIVNATYSDSTDPNGIAPPQSKPFTWQPDEGTLINPPVVSALSRFQGMVVNFKPPADLTSVKQNSVENPTTLILTDPGHVTGYLLALWLARDLNGNQPCAGAWNFSVNPITYDPDPEPSVPSPPSLLCTYTPYLDADGIGGTSNLLGCISNPPIPPAPLLPYPPPYLTPASGAVVPTLTPDLVAVPYNLNAPAVKIAQLKTLIANPTQEIAIPGACYTLVYVPITQSSFGKMGIQQGEIYGFTAWALNASFNQTDPTPNLSLSHANIGYMTSNTADLASLAKDPSLSLSTVDCFVATAASGDINSKAVFYWRILRDEYLTRLGFTAIYYQYGPQAAQWLNNHPRFKPPVNFVLENTGAFFYFSALYTRKAFTWSNAHLKPVLNSLKDLAVEYFQKTKEIISNLWEQKAAAEEQEPTDLSIQIGQSTNYDLALTGGVLFPTSDKKYYREFYPHATVDLELSSSAIFWTSTFGWSIGLKGSYGYNSQNTERTTLGNATQQDTRQLFLGTLEAIAGVRFRSVNFLLLQPGVFVGAGVLRMREEEKPKGDTGQNGSENQNQTIGVTNYSPVFDFGGNLDISLSTLFMYSERELALSKDILLRMSAIYRLNPSKALSSSGLVLNVGFAFLF